MIIVEETHLPLTRPRSGRLQPAGAAAAHEYAHAAGALERKGDRACPHAYDPRGSGGIAFPHLFARANPHTTTDSGGDTYRYAR